MFAQFAKRSDRIATSVVCMGRKRSCARLLLVCIALLITAEAQSRKDQATFSFPGETDRAPSTAGHLIATYKEIRTAPDSAKRYLLSIMDASGNRLVQYTFTRSIQGTWSPYSERIYLNDFMGSTQIDCFVWSRADERLTSLTDVLLHDPNSGPIQGRGAKPPETPENSRFELTCGEWMAKDKILVSLEGDTWAGGQFRYKLVYDLQTKKFSWN